MPRLKIAWSELKSVFTRLCSDLQPPSRPVEDITQEHSFNTGQSIANVYRQVLPDFHLNMSNCIVESDVPPPIEEEAQVEEAATNNVPRISTESAESTSSNSLDNIARLSLSSESTDTNVVRPHTRFKINMRMARL